ncbi:MAG: radical SAM protein, partial [Flavobacteriales bacterium]|nr:radical SAM protein [Flavobacteriales bacterium]
MKNRWRMVSKLTQYKVQNAYQIYRSFKASRKKGLSLMRGLPYSVSIEPTTACNLRCPECPSGLRNFTRPTGNLNRNFFNDFIQANHKHLIYLNFYFQGEPFIHKEFLDMVKIASQNQVFTSTSTNAHFINDSVSEKIVESGLD